MLYQYCKRLMEKSFIIFWKYIRIRISEKSQLLLSVFSDSTDKVSYIRDDGTLMALVVVEYLNKKVLTPNDIQEDIIKLGIKLDSKKKNKKKKI